MDCYLCGASNPPDADFCERCDGQLLKIGLDAEFNDDVDEVLDPEIEESSDAPTDGEEEEPQEKPKKRRLARLKSVEDSRLESALGLGGDDEWDDDPELVIPKAGPAVGIPMIGTRASTVSSKAMLVEKDNRTAYVLLGMLVAAVAWMAYSTLYGSSDQAPESIALVSTTAPVETAPTTVDGPAPWTGSEVGGRYGPTFVRVTLLDCPDVRTQGARTEPLEDWRVYGVAVSEYSVVLPASAVRNADVATIRSRFGNQRPARLTVLPGDIAVASTDRALSRSLDTGDDPEGSDTYYVSYDDEVNVTTVLTEPSLVPVEIAVTDQGDVTSIRLDRSVAEIELLREIATYRTEILTNPTPVANPSACDEQEVIVDATPTETEQDQQEP